MPLASNQTKTIRTFYCSFGLILSLNSILLSCTFRMDTYPHLGSILNMAFDRIRVPCYKNQTFCRLFIQFSLTDTI